MDKQAGTAASFFPITVMVGRDITASRNVVTMPPSSCIVRVAQCRPDN